jgi:hypothetical protein
MHLLIRKKFLISLGQSWLNIDEENITAHFLALLSLWAYDEILAC